MHHISCKGPQIWNALPPHIKEQRFTFIGCFVTTLAKYMIHDYNTYAQIHESFKSKFTQLR